MAVRSRSVLSVVMAFMLLFISLLLPWPHQGNAAAASPSIRILEITDSGVSDLSPLLSQSGYAVETMSMKRFVASRTELDGLYDAVYIGKGKYNPETLPLLDDSNRENSQNTKTKLNDITRLKAQELIDGYVNKGLLVILYSDSTAADGLLYQPAAAGGKSGVLKARFGVYNESGKRRDNVLFVDQAGLNRLPNTLAEAKYNTMLRLRPELQLTESPADYLASPSVVYRAGDKLSFRYSKPDRSGLRANLYVSLDSSLRFQPDQLVASSEAPGASGELSYRMPKGFSGLYYWKLELTDTATGIKSYRSGVIRYRDQQTVIRVLQIMPGKDVNSSLKNNDVLSQSYLSSEDYRIELSTTGTDAFNTKGGAYGYDSIGSKYDMLLFGFRDSYNNAASMSEAAAGAVNAFIATGQSVMFTHDTVFIASGTTDNVWTRNFKGVTGQTGVMTNIGLKAPKPSTLVGKINDGLLTRFPFNLDAGTPSVASTHSQYFMLDLEDPAVIPWYNIKGGTRDDNDSWNHYYTYSKGNVTYSGTGHVFTGGSAGFPDWEERLFVNTMYRAYMGSNHKPELTVYSPAAYSEAAGNDIPSYQKIPVSFTAQDADYKDRKLNAKVEFLYKDSDGRSVVRTMYNSADLQTGALVAEAYENPLPGGGNLTIRFTASDKQGASVTESVEVRVKAVAAQLQVERSASGTLKGVYVEKDKEFQLNYAVRPQPISGLNAQTGGMTIASPSFSEKLPPNVDIVTLPEGFTKSGSLSGGYTISGILPDIRYTSESGDSIYRAEPVNFSLIAKAAELGKLQLDAAALSFRNLGLSAVTKMNFNPLTLEAVIKPALLSLPPEVEIAFGESYKLLLHKEPAEATDIGLEWSSSNTTGVALQEPVKDGIMIRGLQQGASSTVTVTDKLSGLSASTLVRVIQPGLSIDTADKKRSYTLGSRIGLNGLLVKPSSESLPSNAQPVWSVSPQRTGEEGIVELQRTAGQTEWSAGFYPVQPGTYTIKASVNVQAVSSSTGLAEIKTYVSSELTLEVVQPNLQLNGPSVIVAGDDKAAWTRGWGAPQPVETLSRPPTYTWSWEPKSGDTSRLRPLSDNQMTALNTEKPGQGTVAITAAQPLKAGGTAVTIAKTGKEVSIIAKPQLTAGRTEPLLPGESTTLSLQWGAAVPPGHSVQWSVSGSGSLSGDAQSSRQLTASKPNGSGGTATVSATVTMKDTGYTFTIQHSAAVIVPALALHGLPELAVPGQPVPVTAVWKDGYNKGLGALTWGTAGTPASRASIAALAGQPGKAVFTALETGAAKASASLKLTDSYTAVVSSPITIVDFTLPAALEMRQGDQLKLTESGLRISPSALAGDVLPHISWSSGNPSIAAVDADGKLTAKKQGTAIITASYRANSLAGGTLKRTIRVTVKAPEGDRY
ncbi:DUF5057 domain-containing protein [Paenibacillus pasadenensis]|uniref:DUF5057 domain-containing protein n=1 Tax=Paenibacillus pasadenensis TaxID=217090 RepID=UPI00204088D6|nr:DUF5057 domain-containing protein [Paenibacillus pasadenensis]MCM3750064.1 DUF5057 domain-containing protein [Paenibacillus pasadenensis]